LGAGASPELSADLAQLSADVVVGREGTSVCSSQDLLLACGQQPSPAVTPVCDIAETVRRHRAQGRRIVFTNGCFDILHAGHATYLEQARQLGDLLVVGVNSDSSVRRLKGPDRPLVPETERARLVAALDSVDLVAIFEEDSPQGLIELLRPDVYVKGGDYTAEMLPETELVRRLGGRVVLVDYVADHSTTGIVERIRAGSPQAATLKSRLEG
jgi:D-beta-D-heptose 7-phosphate kinase / D-beta-D-heptose 1-phosphate adenosyltransferase